MANVSSLISTVESGLNAVDNRKGKIDNVNANFSKDIGVPKEMADKAENLIFCLIFVIIFFKEVFYEGYNF